MMWLLEHWPTLTGLLTAAAGWLARGRIWGFFIDAGMAQYHKHEAKTKTLLLELKTTDYDKLLREFQACRDQCTHPDSRDSSPG